MFCVTFQPEGKVLPGDLTHYVVPDVGVVVDYMEILEFVELQGVVFTQTTCQAVQHSKGRRYGTSHRSAAQRHRAARTSYLKPLRPLFQWVPRR